jgi:hypothetical protein
LDRKRSSRSPAKLRRRDFLNFTTSQIRPKTIRRNVGRRPNGTLCRNRTDSTGRRGVSQRARSRKSNSKRRIFHTTMLINSQLACVSFSGDCRRCPVRRHSFSDNVRTGRSSGTTFRVLSFAPSRSSEGATNLELAVFGADLHCGRRLRLKMNHRVFWAILIDFN